MNEVPDLADGPLDAAMRAGMRELANSQRCNDCLYIGAPDLHRGSEKVDDGPAFAVVIKSCPDCGGEDFSDVVLCLLCLADGIDNEATHDDYCREHAEQRFEPEDMADFRRDQVQPVRNLTSGNT